MRLILVSDMLQHTDGASHYRGLTAFDAFRETSFYKKIRADLRFVEIDIFYVHRDTKKKIQGAIHVNFWRNFFVDQGGVLTVVDRI